MVGTRRPRARSYRPGAATRTHGADPLGLPEGGVLQCVTRGTFGVGALVIPDQTWAASKSAGVARLARIVGRAQRRNVKGHRKLRHSRERKSAPLARWAARRRSPVREGRSSAFEGDYRGVVDEPVDQRRGD